MVTLRAGRGIDCIAGRELRSDKALFLHGGPGLSSAIERLWYGENLPVYWWDQPKVKDSPSPFSALVNAAANRLEDAASDGPVHLVAHSFGGQIAYALAGRHPSQISRISLLGCPFNPVHGIIRLARKIAAAGGSQEIGAAIDAATKELSLATFQAMVLAGASDPSYPSVYFGPGSSAACTRFLALMQQVDFLDLETFFAVMEEFLHAPPLFPLPGYRGDVRLIMGRDDPVLSAETDISGWKRVLPQAETKIVETGHFIHLESGPEAWLYS